MVGFVDGFVNGFDTTLYVLLLIAGGIAAVLVAVAATAAFLCLAFAVFDWVTDRLGRHWAKAKHRPRGKLAKIILDAYNGKVTEHGEV